MTSVINGENMEEAEPVKAGGGAAEEKRVEDEDKKEEERVVETQQGGEREEVEKRKEEEQQTGSSGKVDGPGKDEETRRKLRAERFGIKKPTAGHAIQEHQRDGFSTGIDLFSPEEIAKKAARMNRFGETLQKSAYPETILSHLKGYQQKGAIEEEKIEKLEELKVARAARFGLQYTPRATSVNVKPQSEKIDVDIESLKQQLRKEREGADMMAVDDYQEANEVAQVLVREDTLHMYGVDLLSSRDCLEYFGEYGPRHVEWINDSSCNVVFADKFTAKRAIFGTGTLVASSTKEGAEQNDVEMSDNCSKSNQFSENVALMWHEGKRFQKGAMKIKLMFRLATVNDKKPEAFKDRKRSRYLWRPEIQDTIVHAANVETAHHKASYVAESIDKSIDRRQKRQKQLGIHGESLGKSQENNNDLETREKTSTDPETISAPNVISPSLNASDK